MKKILGLFLTLSCCLLLHTAALADQQTTVLTQNIKIGNAEASLPYIDGNLDTELERMANDIIRQKGKDMLKRFGNNGDLSYSVTLNRPSVVGILLHASYDGREVYDAVNVDLTTGREFKVNDFFVNNDMIKAVFGKNEDILFAEKGIYMRTDKNKNYEDFVPYTDIMPSIRLGEAGRLMQVARLTKNADGKVLRLPAGGLFAMKLDSNPTTGYSWHLKNKESLKNQVVQVGSSFVMPATDDTRVGTPGTEILMFTALEPGSYDIVMEYKRPWELMVLQSVRFRLLVK